MFSSMEVTWWKSISKILQKWKYILWSSIWPEDVLIDFIYNNISTFWTETRFYTRKFSYQPNYGSWVFLSPYEPTDNRCCGWFFYGIWATAMILFSRWAIGGVSIWWPGELWFAPEEDKENKDRSHAISAFGGHLHLGHLIVPVVRLPHISFGLSLFGSTLDASTEPRARGGVGGLGHREEAIRSSSAASCALSNFSTKDNETALHGIVSELLHNPLRKCLCIIFPN